MDRNFRPENCGKQVWKCFKSAYFLMTALVSKRNLRVFKPVRKLSYFTFDLLPDLTLSL